MVEGHTARLERTGNHLRIRVDMAFQQIALYSKRVEHAQKHRVYDLLSQNAYSPGLGPRLPGPASR